MFSFYEYRIEKFQKNHKMFGKKISDSLILVGTIAMTYTRLKKNNSYRL